MRPSQPPACDRFAFSGSGFVSRPHKIPPPTPAQCYPGQKPPRTTPRSRPPPRGLPVEKMNVVKKEILILRKKKKVEISMNKNDTIRPQLIENPTELRTSHAADAPRFYQKCTQKMTGRGVGGWERERSAYIIKNWTFKKQGL